MADGRVRSRPAAAACCDCRLRARGDGALDAESATRRHWGNEEYDLIGIFPDPRHQTGPAEKSQTRVQVKSRYATDCDHGFPVKEKSLNALDYLIVIFQNIGNFYGRNDGSTGAQGPEFFAHSQPYIREHHEPSLACEKVRLKRLEDQTQPFNNEEGFEQIANALGISRPQKTR